ncbi:DUF6602 domain-containing protein [Vibrio cholerae]|uniref:DUF6602 domain-containing protein n=1 Tax=Vibrio cholerae TaxID=666 RepID=UPI0039673F4A
MNPLEKHLALYSKQLNLKFESIRESYSDSDVKGSQNEEALKKFFVEHYPAWSIRTGCQIINANGDMSDELDVIACNEHQAFAGEESNLLIAEGVDFVVQVKAVLSSNEIDRAIKNCRKLKEVGRAFNQNDLAEVPALVRKEEITRIPYIIFAYTSGIKEETALERMAEKVRNIPYDLQPDALYILDKGKTLLNLRDGSTKMVKKGSEHVSGWILCDTQEHTLSDMLRFVNSQIPIIKRQSSPLKHYLVFDVSTVIGDAQ